MSVGTSLELHHDFETYCDISVRDVGAYAYSMHPSCDVLVLTLGFKDDELITWIPSQEPTVPDIIVEYAMDVDIEFWAHNAQFEYCIWQNVMVPKYGVPPIAHSRYHCTAAMGAAVGMPRSLEKLGAVLKLGIQKDKDGSRLIRKFSCPRKPTKLNKATRVYPQDDPDDFQRYVDYNITDVLTEMQIPERLPKLNKREQTYYRMDLEMNQRGLPLDMDAVHKATPILLKLEQKVIERTMVLTGGIRPTQRDQMLSMFNKLGLDIENLQAKTIKDVMLAQRDDLSPALIELLQLRVEGGKASTKKLKKMMQVVCPDGRVRGGFLFYGAHTGRWSGKLIQPQNFTRGDYKPYQLERLFDLLKNYEAEDIEILYEWPIDSIAQGMRGFIAPPPGKKFVVSDFSAIEARMLAWLANETTVLEIYERNGDVYVRMASKLYKRDESELLVLHKSGDKTASNQRKFGKDIVLGCGYQMGGPGFHKNCYERGIIIEESFAKEAVNVYRKEHPNIVKFWYDTERCAIEAVLQKRTTADPIKLRQLEFYTEAIGEVEWFCIRLPSRYHILRYPFPKIENTTRFNKPHRVLTFRTEIKGQWVREGTYGGKLVENITQAVARDVMAESMVRAEREGYPCIGTVHDELITEVDADFGSAHELEEIMRIRPKWCPTAPVNAEGWEGFRYRK